jgi:hypothetical protein
VIGWDNLRFDSCQVQDFCLLHNMQTVCRAHPTLILQGFSLAAKVARLKLTTHIYQVLSLRICAAEWLMWYALLTCIHKVIGFKS